MCAYCGSQSLTTTDELTREHDEVLGLISRVRDARRGGGTGRPDRLVHTLDLPHLHKGLVAGRGTPIRVPVRPSGET
ncbi:hypothetical protein GCM10010293_45890 [Streptomyces griseoflavus]|uniref:hypothetical protein n=1 Tax=Streptomyces griseoflavus TaxID=35619 RepID=UPI00167E313F|nr:hypothetical protein [Streptomyces griseoflavus]GGV40562.1 hypothetical protein GCM10010293_45890 [Streptomyces griseoflavus]